MATAHAKDENSQGEQQAADDNGLEREPNDRMLHLSHRPSLTARNAQRHRLVGAR